MIRSIRLSLRFIVPLALVMLAAAYVAVPVVDSFALRWFMRDLDTRAQLLGSTLEEPLAQAVTDKAWDRVDAVLNRASRDERLYGMALCGPDNKLLRRTNSRPFSVDCDLIRNVAPGLGYSLGRGKGRLHITAVPVPAVGAGAMLMIVHDMSFVDQRSEDTRLGVVLLFTGLGIVLALITLLIAHMSWRGWVAGVRAMLQGDGVIRPFSQPRPELQPLVGDLRTMLRDLRNERRSHDVGTITWTPAALRSLLNDRLRGDEIIVVSNREPYIHVRGVNSTEVQRPASGLVTAVEPVMRACSGTWIAHGSGSADRENVDKNDHLQVPPRNPSYTLRRIWLTREQENGYYYGFANEGLWPLCHIAHVRPIFRDGDWAQYRAVNERFADAVVEEAKTPDPVVLVHDYHLALVPRLIRSRLPRATVITFWHIPWPNSESFGICPWRNEILDGLLGSTIVGFHTRYHCNNFLQTVDRFLEARIDYEDSTVSFGSHLTQIESFPISIAWPEASAARLPVDECRQSIRQRLSVPADQALLLGIDRLDYTKGIIERLRAVERLFEMYPQCIGRITFVQIAAPSRSSLEEYQRFESQVRMLAESINRRFGNAPYQPVVLLIEHHNAEAVQVYYRAADVCVVTSLHDGMNLVAKEFVAARDDDAGVLVLSQFAGAASELHEALIVNPYHVEEVAETLNRALTMPASEQRERMTALRQHVREFNVYRWAGRMLLEAARFRQRERIAERIGEGVAEPA